jgi:hypothetical protein
MLTVEDRRAELYPRKSNISGCKRDTDKVVGRYTQLFEVKKSNEVIY